jgi:hypothetical protein
VILDRCSGADAIGNPDGSEDFNSSGDAVAADVGDDADDAEDARVVPSSGPSST